MKVGIIAEPLRGRGGIPRYTRELIRGLEARLGANGLRLYDHDAGGEFIHLEREVVRTPTRRWLKTYGWYPVLALRARPGVDLVHNPGQIPHYFRFRAPTVVTVHDLSHLLTPQAYRWRKRAAYALLFRRSLAVADRVIAVSQATRRDLVEHLGLDPQRVHVVHHGVDDRFRLDVDPAEARARLGLDTPYVLFVGKVGPRKNLGVLAQAVARLAATGLPHKLLVAGATDERGAEQERALQGLGGRLLRTGPWPERDLPLLYAGASALAMPSLLEGFGLPAAEAMAAGCPVLVSDTGALPEVAGGAGLCLPPSDPTAWAGALERVLGDPALAARMRTDGRRRAEAFRWDAAVDATLDVYARALGRPVAAPPEPAEAIA